MSQGRQTRDGVAVRRVQVMLDDATIERAKALGDGNVSQGIRQAIASLPTPTRQTERGVLIPLNSGHQSGRFSEKDPASAGLRPA